MIENEAKVKIRLDIEKAKEQLGELQKQSSVYGEASYQIKPPVTSKEYKSDKKTEDIDREIKDQQSKIDNLIAIGKYGLRVAQNPASIMTDVKNAEILPYVSPAELARAVMAKRLPVPDLISAQDYENKLSTLISANAVAAGATGIQPGSITDVMIKAKANLEAIEPTAQMLQTAIAGEKLAHSPITGAGTAKLAEHFYRANRKMSEYQQYKQVVTTGAVTGAMAELAGNSLQEMLSLITGGNQLQ